MPEVNVEIDGRKYRMACEEGQEAHLLGLAERFNRSIDGLKGAFGEIGDNRLTVMAGIAVLDELAEAERRIAPLQAGHRRPDPGRRRASRARPKSSSASSPSASPKPPARSKPIATAIDETGAPGN